MIVAILLARVINNRNHHCHLSIATLNGFYCIFHIFVSLGHFVDLRLENTAVRFNKRTVYNVNHIFVHQQNNAAILEIDGFQPFNEFNQPAVLPHVPFNGPSEVFVMTYLDDDLAYLTQKHIK